MQNDNRNKQEQTSNWDMPPRIDATPEEIARVVLRASPKKKWRYMRTKRERDDDSK